MTSTIPGNCFRFTAAGGRDLLFTAWVVGAPLVFAAFPAVYALTWVCAHDPTRTKIAAWLLVSAHLAFWRIVLDTRITNRESRIVIPYLLVRRF